MFGVNRSYLKLTGFQPVELTDNSYSCRGKSANSP